MLQVLNLLRRRLKESPRIIKRFWHNPLGTAQVSLPRQDLRHYLRKGSISVLL
jgi:hypothetical protein